jgi:hypothetical protein
VLIKFFVTSQLLTEAKSVFFFCGKPVLFRRSIWAAMLLPTLVGKLSDFVSLGAVNLYRRFLNRT